MTYTFGIEFDTHGLGEIETQRPAREALVRFFALRWMDPMMKVADEIVDGTFDGVAEYRDDEQTD